MSSSREAITHLVIFSNAFAIRETPKKRLIWANFMGKTVQFTCLFFQWHHVTGECTRNTFFPSHTLSVTVCNENYSLNKYFSCGAAYLAVVKKKNQCIMYRAEESGNYRKDADRYDVNQKA